MTSSLPVHADESNDHRAKVFNVEGDVRILKSSAENWTAAKKDMLIEQGDQVLTGKASHVEFVYDETFMNIARIDENTKAEFRSIEPTDLHLEDGAIFSALDSLPKGASYSISTPTAVASVRGTHFDAAFDAETQTASFATFSVPEDGHESSIAVTDILDSGAAGKTVEVPEGSQLDLNAGQTLDTANLVVISPERAESAKEAFSEMSEAGAAFKAEASASSSASEDKKDSSKNEKSQEASGGDDGEGKKEDSNKLPGGGNPPDQGGGGPSGGDATGAGAGPNLLSSAESESGLPGESADANSLINSMADSLIPEEGVKADSSGEDSKGDANKEAKAKDSGEEKSKSSDGDSSEGGKSETKMPVYTDAVASFLGVGMGSGSDTENGGGDLSGHASQLMENLGFEPDFAKDFGNFVDKYSDIGGDFTDFMGGSAYASDMTNGFDAFGEGGGFDMAALTEAFDSAGVNPSDLGIDLSDIAQIAAESSFDENFTEDTTENTANSNPYYDFVLDILEHDFTATEKAALISGGNGTEIVRGSAVLGNVDGDSNSERIYGVRYFNDGGDINAEYSHIDDAVIDGGATIQAAGSSPYVIYAPNACYPSDKESSCP